MNKIKPLEEMWVVVNKSGYPYIESVAIFEHESKRRAIMYVTGLEDKSWNWWKEQGYRCIQVNIIFEECE